MLKHLHRILKSSNFALEKSRDRAVVAHWAHNPEVVGSNPAPATKARRVTLSNASFFWRFPQSILWALAPTFHIIFSK